jgi:hypothetical protein
VHNLYQEAARHEWSQARRKALWLQLRASLGSKKINLIDFTQLAERFDLGNASYRGVQSIPLAKIVGSLGRYNDFVQAFLPTTENMSQRWQKVATLYLDPSSPGVLPIEVYQVGDSYFVSDGNHRVSVARQLGVGHIEAHVWEYFKPVAGLAPGVDIDTLVIEAERRDFLEITHLDELRPDHTIRLTAPGGYREMLNQIARYQQVLSWIDVTETPYEAAVTAWYDMIYKSTVLLIENSGVMKMFSNRTAADFFIWVRQHHQELEEQYGQPVLLEEAVSDINTQHQANFLHQSWRTWWGWLKQRFG